MLAKLVVWGPNRHSAIGRMQRALESFPVLGVTTNIPFLLKAIVHSDFASGEYDTGFIVKHQSLTTAPESSQLQAVAVDIAEGFWQSNGSNTPGQKIDAHKVTQSPWHGLVKSVFP